MADGIDAIIEAMRELARSHVLVGIPQAAAGRTEGDIDNATLGYIHEYGSPARNIPSRAFLRPGVAQSQQRWLPHLKNAAHAVVKSPGTDVDDELTAAGIIAATAVKERIVAGIPPPLAPRTVRRRAQRLGAAAVATTTPLVDTAQLLNSITSVVRKR